MGVVYLGSSTVGTCEPQEIGTTGDVWLDSTDVGDFNLSTESGTVFMEGVTVGTYSGMEYPALPTGFIQPKIIQTKVIGEG